VFSVTSLSLNSGFRSFFFIIFNQNLGKQLLDHFICPYKVHTKSPSSGRWLNDGSLNVFETLVYFSPVISKTQRQNDQVSAYFTTANFSYVLLELNVVIDYISTM